MKIDDAMSFLSSGKKRFFKDGVYCRKILGIYTEKDDCTFHLEGGEVYKPLENEWDWDGIENTEPGGYIMFFDDKAMYAPACIESWLVDE